MKQNCRLLIFILLVLFLGCEQKTKDKKEWTYLVYMAADNGLTYNAIEDINEMEMSFFDRNKMNVVVQVDWEDPYKEEGVFRYLIQTDSDYEINSTLVQKLAEHNSGDPQRLTDFINWGMNEFPAEQYVLIIWSHGNGWYRENKDFTGLGLCPDITQEGEIAVHNGELRQALAGIDQKIDLCIMDACHMQSIEVAEEIYPFFDYILASEYEVPTDGFPYQRCLNEASELTNTKEIATMFLENYDHFYFNQFSNPPIFTMSLLDTAQFPNLKSHWNSFWTENDSIFSSKRIANIQKNLFYFQNPERDVDIYQFFEELKNQDISDSLVIAIDSLQTAFDNAYIETTKYGIPNAGYTAIWFPNSPNTFELMKNDYQELDFADNIWFSLLQSYFEEK